MTTVVDDNYALTTGTTLQDGPTVPPPPFSVLITPPLIDETQASCPLRSPTVATANPTGGVAPYTFFWEKVAGGGVHTIDSPNDQSTTFTHFTSFGVGAGTYRCTVTDSVGDTAFDEIIVDLTCGA